jgi:hypothetical protein
MCSEAERNAFLAITTESRGGSLLLARRNEAGLTEPGSLR